MRVPMTPEAEAKWRAELAIADAIIDSEEIETEEDTDQFAFSPKQLERRKQKEEKNKENPEYRTKMNGYYKDYRLKNLEKCKSGQHDWYMRHKEEIAKQRKAARLLQKSSGGAKENI